MRHVPVFSVFCHLDRQQLWCLVVFGCILFHDTINLKTALAIFPSGLIVNLRNNFTIFEPNHPLGTFTDIPFMRY